MNQRLKTAGLSFLAAIIGGLLSGCGSVSDYSVRSYQGYMVDSPFQPRYVLRSANPASATTVAPAY